MIPYGSKQREMANSLPTGTCSHDSSGQEEDNSNMEELIFIYKLYYNTSKK